uniref:Uncharacterized protein n=1 Tax=Haptolina ericina TaxID=156174 RepID=A0A7S3F2N9_9EUKA|mmetsp:Transcript_49788/g.111933  ORF Transcript_49788/g.111933 Transcript_49788/m.111933 type:complete len:358 (+) Transcript_49788:74-1147(+)
MSGRGDDSLLLRFLKPVDELVSVKLLLRVWGPRFEFIVRLILVATFLDDSYRVATQFSEHTKQVGEEGYLQSLAATSPAIVSAIATVALGIGLLAQLLGSIFLLALLHPDAATKALIGWVIAQPILYAQVTNVEFVTESLSLIGGLLILRAHLSESVHRSGRRVPLGGASPDEAGIAPETAIAFTQLLGRLLLPAVYLYHAGLLLLSNLGYTQYRADRSLPMLAVNTAVLVGLVLGCMLVAAGLKSRTVALSLAIISLGYVCYQHPFFSYCWREGGEWKCDEVALRKRKSMPHVVLPMELSPRDFESWLIVDLHRYYFFHGLSTAGALMLLAQFGPGAIAVEADEVLLGDMEKALNP